MKTLFYSQNKKVMHRLFSLCFQLLITYLKIPKKSTLKVVKYIKKVMKKQFIEHITSLCRTGVLNDVFPGVSVTIAIREKENWIFFEAAAGKIQRGRQASEVNASTFFDLASLTKPLCTTLLCFCLVKQKKLDLNARLADLPCCKDYPDPWRNIPLMSLLSHSSGLPAYQEYFRAFASKQNIESKKQLLAYILSEKQIYTPLSHCLYSDLGFILLGNILEELTGAPLDELFLKNIAAPLGIEANLNFWRIGKISPSKNVAATEQCPWRGYLLKGEVHDEHAWLLEGVAGHAGLFGQAQAVAKLCVDLVDIRHGLKKHPFIQTETLCQAFSYKTQAGLWSLGFDRPSPGSSSSGIFFSPESLGHLGFTGTSFWMDLQRKIVVVLLSNRVNPSRKNIKIRAFRPWFHNEVMQRLLF